MNSETTQTLAERLYAKSFDAFVDTLPTTYKRGTVMKCCLSSFKKNLDQEAGLEINNYKLSYDAACTLIFRRDCEISDLKDKVNKLEAKLVERKELVERLRYEINNPGWDEEFYQDAVTSLEEEVKLLRDCKEASDDLLDCKNKEIERLDKEKQKLAKKVQQFEESASKLKKQKRKQFTVLFPTLKFD
jgi:chromosome segregation ATPase